MGKLLVVLGLALVAIGLAWPWLGKIPWGRLPGDIVVERENVRFYFPLMTGLIASIVLTIVIWLLRK